MIVCFVDIGGIVDHHCLIFLSIKEKEKDLPNQSTLILYTKSYARRLIQEKIKSHITPWKKSKGTSENIRSHATPWTQSIERWPGGNMCIWHIGNKIIEIW